MKTQTQEQKKTVKFKDASGNVANIELEITHCNGYAEFTAHGDYSNGGGQIVDNIKPKNEPQKKLIELWNTYHLNGMNAGTKKQSAVLKAYKEKTNTKQLDYDGQKEVLNNHGANGEALTVFELKSINEQREEIKGRITIIKEKVNKLNLASSKLVLIAKSFQMGGQWVKVPSEVLNLPRTKERDINKHGYKFYDSIFKMDRDKKDLLSKAEKLTKQAEKIEVDELPAVLLKTMLFDVHPETGKPYQYGTEWITENLPLDIWEQVEKVVSDIEEAEAEEHKEEIDVSELDFQTIKEGSKEADILERIEDEHGDDAEKVLAFAINEGLTDQEAIDEVSIDENRLTYGGTDYLVGNDEEMDEHATEYIKSSLWAFNASFLANYSNMPIEVFEALQPQCEGANDAIEAIIEKSGSIEDFAQKAISADGRGHFLNNWDGTEDSQTVNDTEYYICRN